MKNKKCTDCKYSLQVDYGHSNWTIEGTDIYCLLEKNPNFPIDRFYGEEPTLKFVNECVYFKSGDSVFIDAERDSLDYDEKYALGLIKFKEYKENVFNSYSNYSDDPEIKPMLIKWAKENEDF